MRSKNAGASRRIGDSTWEKVRKLAAFSIRDLGSMPQSSIAALIISTLVIAATRTATIYSTTKEEGSNNRSSVNKWFYTFMQDKISFALLPNSYLVAVVWCVFVTLLFKSAAVGYLLYLNYKGRSNSE